MILVSEIAHPGEIHLEVNSSLLEIIADIYPADQIVFRAETAHSDAVSLYFQQPGRVQYYTFKKYYDPKNFTWFKRITGEIKEVSRSLKAGKKLNADTYFWTCLFPTGHLFLSIYLLLFGNRNTKHIIALHGELEFLKNANKKKVNFFLGVILKWAMILSKKDTRYIVFGDRIKEHLKAYFSESVLDKVIAILHPYHYDLDNHLPEFKRDMRPVAFGAIGTQMLSKNSNQIFDLAQRLHKEVAAGDLSFVTIGRVLPELSAFENKLVTQLYAGSFVPQLIFGAETRKLNFVLFFYNNDAYQLCPSGAIFEVLKLGLPVISTHNDYFDWLFQKYGEMGFLCNTLDEMSLLIKNIAAGNLDADINRILKTIQQFKKDNNLESIAVDLAGKI